MTLFVEKCRINIGNKVFIYLIYIQAKRYSDRNTVGRKEVQTFVGVVENVQKLVFITTSIFTKEVIFLWRCSQKVYN